MWTFLSLCRVERSRKTKEERYVKSKNATNMQFSVVCSGVLWSDMMLASDDLLFMCSVTKQKY